MLKFKIAEPDDSGAVPVSLEENGYHVRIRLAGILVAFWSGSGALELVVLPEGQAASLRSLGVELDTDAQNVTTIKANR